MKTTTQSSPEPAEGGNPLTTSRDITSHRPSGTSKGVAIPRGATAAFVRWHTSHEATYSSTSLAIAGQYNPLARILATVRLAPMCPDDLASWACSKTSRRFGVGTHSRYTP